MMGDSVLEFYEELADYYHQIFVDWHHAITWQGDVLNKFIRSQLGKDNNASILDCSCGIGTQAIGLAKHGYKVTATDISPSSIERAKKEAVSFDVSINFGIADFRSLEKDVDGVFDIVISCDNGIPHLLKDEDLLLAACNMYSKTNDGGMLLITIRDYDKLVKEKPKAFEPRVFDNGKRIVFQVWDWHNGGKNYTVNQFILQELNGKWHTKHYKTQYRALVRQEFSDFLRKAGFRDVEWYMSVDSGFYQPIVTARKVN